MTHHSRGNRVGLVTFLMTQRGSAHSYCGAQAPAFTCLPSCWPWKGVLGEWATDQGKEGQARRAPQAPPHAEVCTLLSLIDPVTLCGTRRCPVTWGAMSSPQGVPRDRQPLWFDTSPNIPCPPHGLSLPSRVRPSPEDLRGNSCLLVCFFLHSEVSPFPTSLSATIEGVKTRT